MSWRSRSRGPGIAVVAIVSAVVVLWGSASAASAKPTEFQLIDGNGHVRSYQHPDKFKFDFGSNFYVKVKKLNWNGWGAGRSVARGVAKHCEIGYGCKSGKVKVVAKSRTGCARYDLYRKVIVEGVPGFGGQPLKPGTLGECTG